MEKNRTRKIVLEVGSTTPTSSSKTSILRKWFFSPGVALRELVMRAGLESFKKILEQDREELCGPKSRPHLERSAYRHGHDQGRVVLGGRKVVVSKPRVRTISGKEVELPCRKRAKEEDPLQERVVEPMLVGVSSRGYARSLESMGDEAESVGTSRSSFSRHLVARTAKQVEEFLSCPLGERDFPVLLLDGTGFDDHVLVTAMGIDVEGHKHVLGVVEGSTESEQVCVALLRDIIERGLPVERARLFVIDGGKGLRKAIRTVFGAWALIQRCQIHKARNVVEHLPKGKRAWVRAALRRAWSADTVSAARGKLERLACQLEEEHAGAAASIREGLEETLTLIALGVGGWLRRSVYSTNSIENLQGTLKRISKKVKRWRGGAMALRRAVTALMEAQKHFRRVKGYRELPQLMAALEAMVPAAPLSARANVA